jgi:hypothetical protein
MADENENCDPSVCRPNNRTVQYCIGADHQNRT